MKVLGGEKRAEAGRSTHVCTHTWPHIHTQRHMHTRTHAHTDAGTHVSLASPSPPKGAVSFLQACGSDPPPWPSLADLGKVPEPSWPIRALPGIFLSDLSERHPVCCENTMGLEVRRLLHLMLSCHVDQMGRENDLRMGREEDQARKGPEGRHGPDPLITPTSRRAHDLVSLRWALVTCGTCDQRSPDPGIRQRGAQPCSPASLPARQ